MANNLLRAVGMWLALFLSIGVPGTAAAAGIFQLADIYEVQVPVAEQSEAALAKAFQAAMPKVLVRVTGNTGAPSAPGMDQVIQQAKRYVQSYRFVEVSAAAGGAPAAPVRGAPSVPSATTQPAAQAREAVRVHFDESALNQAIRAHGLPVWGRERPRTLVWLGVRAGGQRGIVNADDATDTAAALVNTALQRGIPVLFPLMDLQDQRQVAPADVWAGFYDHLLGASGRYPHTDVLVVSASQAGAAWQADWTLLQSEKISAQWSTQAKTLADALAQGTNRLADNYAERYAVQQGGGGNQVRVVVAGVSSAADYARVADYLSSITAVRDAQVVDVAGDQATFSLSVSAGIDYLQRVINLGGVLGQGQPPAVSPPNPVTPAQPVPTGSGGVPGAAPAPTQAPASAAPSPPTLYLKLTDR